MVSSVNSWGQLQESCAGKEADEGEWGGAKAKERIFAAIGEEGVASAAQAATLLSGPKS